MDKVYGYLAGKKEYEQELFSLLIKKDELNKCNGCLDIRFLQEILCGEWGTTAKKYESEFAFLNDNYKEIKMWLTSDSNILEALEYMRDALEALKKAQNFKVFPPILLLL